MTATASQLGLAVCVAHQGQHGVSVLGDCAAVGAEVPRPFRFRFGRCETCGIDLDYRQEARTSEIVALAAGTDSRHVVHAPPLRVALDEDALAGALVRAAAAMRPPPRPANPPATSEPRPAGPPGKAPLGAIQGFDE